MKYILIILILLVISPTFLVKADMNYIPTLQVSPGFAQIFWVDSGYVNGSPFVGTVVLVQGGIKYDFPLFYHHTDFYLGVPTHYYYGHFCRPGIYGIEEAYLESSFDYEQVYIPPDTVTFTGFCGTNKIYLPEIY